MKYRCCFAILFSLVFVARVWAQSVPVEPEQTRESTSNHRQPTNPSAADGVEVVSDTLGVDFRPYLRTALMSVKENWYKLIPNSARAPKMTRGDVVIQIAILKNGKIAGMKLVENSGDVQMGTAAWHSIGDSRFPSLPSEFRGQYVLLRLHFSYNPAKPNGLILQFHE